MSVRYEGAYAKYTGVYALKAGEEIGDDVVPEGQIAVVFSYDEVFYIVGTAEELSHLMGAAKAMVNYVESDGQI
jgi:hypothetical protein